MLDRSNKLNPLVHLPRLSNTRRFLQRSKNEQKNLEIKFGIKFVFSLYFIGYVESHGIVITYAAAILLHAQDCDCMVNRFAPASCMRLVQV